jgi:hypothetical protein
MGKISEHYWRGAFSTAVVGSRRPASGPGWWPGVMDDILSSPRYFDTTLLRYSRLSPVLPQLKERSLIQTRHKSVQEINILSCTLRSMTAQKFYNPSVGLHQPAPTCAACGDMSMDCQQTEL